MVKLGDVKINNAVLAPMAGYGDVAFRRICRDYGAGLTTTEMVSVKGLCYNNSKTEELLTLAKNETPSCVQLFGSDPEFFARALEKKVLNRFDVIDINMGCPVPKVVKNGEGSALMKTPDLASKIVETCVKHSSGRPVTVKHRIGYNDVTAVEFAKKMQDAGASAITVHGRTANQMYRGEANWKVIDLVASSVKIPVFGNGDITGVTVYDHYKKNTAVAEIAIGRGALGHPGIFADVSGGVSNDKIDVILRHLSYALSYFSEKVAVRTFRKHLSYYLKGVPQARELRGKLNLIDTACDLKRELLALFSK